MRTLKNQLLMVLSLTFMCACQDDDDPPAPMQPFRISINSGGPAFTFEGKEWLEDQYHDASTPYSIEIPIAGTDNDFLYQSEIVNFDDPSFTYNIPIPGNGFVLVELHFAEIWWGINNGNGVAGERVFNVDIEGGQARLTNYDIIAEAGAPATAIKEEFPGIMVDDGFVTIVFTSVTDLAKVSGIEVSSAF